MLLIRFRVLKRRDQPHCNAYICLRLGTLIIAAAIFEEAKMAPSGLQRKPGLVSDLNEHVNHH